MGFSFLWLWVDFDGLWWVDFGGLWLWQSVVVGLILGFSYYCWLIMGSGGFMVAVDCGGGGGWGGLWVVWVINIYKYIYIYIYISFYRLF